VARVLPILLDALEIAGGCLPPAIKDLERLKRTGETANPAGFATRTIYVLIGDAGGERSGGCATGARPDVETMSV
jgi:hypothetical protein